MNYKLLFSAFAITLLFASCNRQQYARVQPTKLEDFSAKENLVLTPDIFAIESLNLETADVSIRNGFYENTANELPIVRMPVESRGVTRPTINKSVKVAPFQTLNTSKGEPTFKKTSVTKERKTTAKKKKLFNRSNTLIPSGLVLLGVAILLSLINLNGLALLFGAASILFLYLGIRKMIRKNNRRKIFKR